MLVLLFYTLFHALFLTDHWLGLAKTLQNILFTTVFMLTSILALRMPPWLFSRLLTGMVYIVIIMGVAAIAWHIGYIGMTRRLEPFGRTHHAILGANVFSVFALCGVYLAHPATPGSRRLSLPALAAIVVAVLIGFTESRGPMLSFGISGLVALVLLRQYIPLLCVFIAMAAIAADGLGYMGHHHAFLPLTPLYDAFYTVAGAPLAPWWHLGNGHRPDCKTAVVRVWMQAPFSVWVWGVNPIIFSSPLFFIPGLSAVACCWPLLARRFMRHGGSASAPMVH